MGLYQRSVLKNYIESLDKQEVKEAYTRFQAIFHNPDKQKNIRSSKEEQYQEGFLRDLFVHVLGYTINPDPNYNLLTEVQNVTDQKKADAAILVHEEVKAVVELKGTNTIDLDKVQDQAFRYYNNHPKAIYIITSNFEKIRFYIQKTNEYEEYHLFTLDYAGFCELFLSISYSSISRDIPLKIKKESVVREQDITKSLYKDYSVFKRELFQDLCQHNKEVDKMVLFKASQKLIDRFLFILFCEDNNGLLPPNSIAEIIKHWNKLREMDEYKPLYEIFKKYFEYINTGRPASQERLEIFAYNGGLFAEDGLLDSLVITDTILYTHTQKLSSYDFISEVDVNILGHIFEHSLTEIEEVQAELEGNAIDKTKSKRKKDGVFYTPRYITEYIVENTVGKLFEDKKAELGILEDIFVEAKTSKERNSLHQKLQEYKNYVLSLTICDPACGSGAFLNQALVFLLKEHQYIAELENKLFDTSIVMTDVTADILENNLFGVDINEESVEIARLSLWLRSAKKGRKLNNLSSNIKCGNSLIDDPEVTGDKAFNWEKEFPQVFEKGGFDVVIGNPPYGASFSEDDKSYLINKYATYEYQVNSYVLFYERGIEIVKNYGLLGFITPSTFSYQLYFRKLRSCFQQYNQYIIVKYLFEVFNDADIGDAITWILIKSNNVFNDIKFIVYDVKDTGFGKINLLKYSDVVNNDGTYNLLSSELNISRFQGEKFSTLSDICSITVGIKAYQTGKGTPKQTAKDVKDKPFTSIEKIDETYLECIVGSDFNRYRFTGNKRIYLSYGKWLAEPRESAPFFKEKIILRQTSDSLICTLDSECRINLNNVYNVGLESELFTLKYILSILNSKLLNYIYQQIAQEKGRLFAEVKKVYLSRLPIKNLKIGYQEKLSSLADIILTKNSIINKKLEKFKSRIKGNLELETLEISMEFIIKGSFRDFISFLKKQRVALSLKEQDEWEDYFNTYKSEINDLQTEIDRVEKEIDRMVYELYGLSEEEIKIVENG